jgi:hypothetical protein
VVADLLFSKTENRNLGIILAYQLNISIDIDFSPVYRLPVTVENHQCLAHCIAEMAILSIIKIKLQVKIFILVLMSLPDE